MKIKTFLADSLFVLALLCQSPTHGQAPTPIPRRPTPVPGTATVPQLAHLPDLVIYSVQFAPGSTPDTSEKTRIAVTVRNNGDQGFATANVKGPTQVWLRMWKPARAQGLAEAEPKATTFTWGGVLKLGDLAAGESKDLWFEVPKPPGGWETTGGGGIGFVSIPREWKNPSDPLRLRIVARADSNDAVKEMDESNNDRFIFEFAPSGSGPVLSIKTVQQPSNQPVIKVLVENLGTKNNNPGAKIKFQLKEQIKEGSQDTDVDVFFWVPGKPTPHGAGGTWMGQPAGQKVVQLTQQDVDALPPTTKIPQTFQKNLLIPVIAPHESVWLTVDFTLPDPGTYIRPDSTHPSVSKYQGASQPATYVKSLTQSEECSNLTAFYASRPRIAIRIDQKNWYQVTGARAFYNTQLSPAFFKSVNYVPPNKYVGCK